MIAESAKAETGTRAVLDYVNQRIAKRQRELEGAVKHSSHYAQVEAVLQELKAVRAKCAATLRREGSS